RRLPSDFTAAPRPSGSVPLSCRKTGRPSIQVRTPTVMHLPGSGSFRGGLPVLPGGKPAGVTSAGPRRRRRRRARPRPPRRGREPPDLVGGQVRRPEAGSGEERDAEQYGDGHGRAHGEPPPLDLHLVIPPGTVAGRVT